ncbi:MAG TPA: hypothetical protein VH083_08280 [Myxococcales bacterium]|nr:hypothetical protein [Myxococcales bacterium]
MKRFRPAQVTPLEIWNAKIGGRTLFEWQALAEFPQALAQVARGLRKEHGFEHVHLLGGAARREGVAQALHATVSADPVFAAVRAGARISPACADVGQTAIKLAQDGKVWSLPRDEARPALELIAKALSQLSGPCLLALPCALDEDLRLTDCSYGWGAADLAPLLRLAHLDEETALIMNDAELAALAALDDPQVPPVRTLVLTLGFGVGAALLR